MTLALQVVLLRWDVQCLRQVQGLMYWISVVVEDDGDLAPYSVSHLVQSESISAYMMVMSERVESGRGHMGKVEALS